MDVNEFAELVLAQTKARLKAQYPDSPQHEWEQVQVVPGPKYTKVDIGPKGNMSGKYMIENATGVIYGIKGYGRVHKGHTYGTLDTVGDWDWSGYTGIKRQNVTVVREIRGNQGKQVLVRRGEDEYFIVSTIPGETLVFPANSAGKPTSMGEVRYASGRDPWTRENAIAALERRER